jgi:hypothetical protein
MLGTLRNFRAAWTVPVNYTPSVPFEPVLSRAGMSWVYREHGGMMDRRTFLKSAAIGAAAAGIAGKVLAVDKYFPTKVDASLFETGRLDITVT